MGKTHMFGFATASRVFDLPFTIELDCIADATPELARQARDRFGFRRYAENWQQLAEDPTIDVLDITAPNALHRDMAMAGAAAGKHIYCEKPLATSVAARCGNDPCRGSGRKQDAGGLQLSRQPDVQLGETAD